MFKISIIIPVYNIADYIIRCINSVINQSYSNIECILVDDYSTDDSLFLINRCLENYCGPISFTVLCHSENKGSSIARNTGTLRSTGDYIYYLDCDDELLPDTITDLINLLNKYPNVELVQGNTKTLPELPAKEDWRNIAYKDFPEYIESNLWIRQHFYDIHNPSIPVNAWNKLIDRNFLMNNQLFFREGLIIEDELWMFYLVKKLKFIAFTTKYTYLHHIRPGSIMQSEDKRGIRRDCAIMLDEVCENFDEPLRENQKMKYLSMLYHYLSHEESNLGKENFYDLYKKVIIRNSKRELKKFNLVYVIHFLMFSIPVSFKKNIIYKKVYNVFLRYIVKENLL